MTKKKATHTEIAVYTIDGKPASIPQIVEASGDKELWKSYLERVPHSSPHRYLEKYLGKYVTASEIHWAQSMRDSSLRRWRNNGKVRAEHIRGHWYYSLEDIVRAIKEE